METQWNRILERENPEQNDFVSWMAHPSTSFQVKSQVPFSQALTSGSNFSADELKHPAVESPSSSELSEFPLNADQIFGVKVAKKDGASYKKHRKAMKELTTILQNLLNLSSKTSLENLLDITVSTLAEKATQVKNLEQRTHFLLSIRDSITQSSSAASNVSPIHLQYFHEACVPLLIVAADGTPLCRRNDEILMPSFWTLNEIQCLFDSSWGELCPLEANAEFFNLIQDDRMPASSHPMIAKCSRSACAKLSLDFFLHNVSSTRVKEACRNLQVGKVASVRSIRLKICGEAPLPDESSCHRSLFHSRRELLADVFIWRTEINVQRRICVILFLPQT